MEQPRGPWHGTTWRVCRRLLMKWRRGTPRPLLASPALLPFWFVGAGLTSAVPAPPHDPLPRPSRACARRGAPAAAPEGGAGGRVWSLAALGAAGFVGVAGGPFLGWGGVRRRAAAQT